jgi:hypothetical protein
VDAERPRLGVLDVIYNGVSCKNLARAAMRLWSYSSMLGKMTVFLSEKLFTNDSITNIKRAYQ